MSFHVPEKYRSSHARMSAAEIANNSGNQGFFVLPPTKTRAHAIRILASDGAGWVECGFPAPAWEHVSVSLVSRCPTWDEMCLVKSLFWDAEDVVLQFHPRESEYVSLHNFCLHLWRPVGVEFPSPPSAMVGPVGRQ